MTSWLKDIVYQIGISWTTFLQTELIAGLIAAVKVISQTIRAASPNPVKSIKSQ